MGGEGICFLHSPPGIAPRPRNTGWYAAFGALAGPQDEVAYAESGWRFMGATFDPSGLYRFDAVLAWMAEHGIDAGTAQAHAQPCRRSSSRGCRRCAIPCWRPPTWWWRTPPIAATS